MLAQLLLQPRPGGAGLDPRRQRLRVDLQHPIQPPQVERDERPIPQPRLDPADHAGPAAERDHRRPLRLGPAQHRLDLRLVPRQRHQIRRILEFPPEPPHHVPIGLPQRVRRPARSCSSVNRSPRSAGAFNRGARSSTSSSGTASSSSPPNPNRSRIPRRSLLQLLPRGRLILIPPPPVLQPPLAHGSIAGIAGDALIAARQWGGVAAGACGAAPASAQPTPRSGSASGESSADGRPRAARGAYQCTPFIRWAKATASVVGALSGASSPFPLAACDSGNSL